MGPAGQRFRSSECGGGGRQPAAFVAVLLFLLPAAHDRAAAQNSATAMDSTAVVTRVPLDSASDSVRPAARLPVTTIRARERSRDFLRADFERRRERGRGTFFTREDLERRGWPGLIELLQGEPGVDIGSGRFRGASGASLNPAKRPCRPVLVLDALRMTRSDDPPLTLKHALESIAGPDMSAVELYRGMAQLPAGLGGLEARCGAILVWTKRPADELRRIREEREERSAPDSAAIPGRAGLLRD